MTLVSRGEALAVVDTMSGEALAAVDAMSAEAVTVVSAGKVKGADVRSDAESEVVGEGWMEVDGEAGDTSVMTMVEGFDGGLEEASVAERGTITVVDGEIRMVDGLESVED